MCAQGCLIPNRLVEDLDDPLPQRVRTASQGERGAGDAAFRARRRLMTSEPLGIFVVSDNDLDAAGHFPLGGRSAYGVIFLKGGPHRGVDPRIFDLNLPGLPTTHSLSRTADVDLLSVASQAGGARVIPKHEFRMIGEDGRSRRTSECGSHLIGRSGDVAAATGGRGFDLYPT